MIRILSILALVSLVVACAGGAQRALIDERRACLGNGQGAIEACTRIIARDVPRDVLIEAYINRGNARVDTGDIDGALADMQAVIDLDPDDPLAYFNRGDAYLKLDKPERAIAEFSRSIELDPNYAPSYSMRGSVYSLVDKHALALADHDRALSLEPKDAVMLYNRALSLFFAQDYERALTDLDAALRVRASYGVARELRAEVLRILQQQKAGNGG
ncbi:tetratricopeptide repeat protein [Pelagibius sp.]|uniref:tetratricopeptide repeat protein n=1 Tax=Pelagibius sp. TaxID=1931238 RepID=UPI003B5029F3